MSTDKITVTEVIEGNTLTRLTMEPDDLVKLIKALKKMPPLSASEMNMAADVMNKIIDNEKE